MKHHYAEPAGRHSSDETAQSAEPEKLVSLAGDPVAKDTDNREEQKNAFIKPDSFDKRVKESEGGQGRTS